MMLESVKSVLLVLNLNRACFTVLNFAPNSSQNLMLAWRRMMGGASRVNIGMWLHKYQLNDGQNDAKVGLVPAKHQLALARGAGALDARPLLVGLYSADAGLQPSRPDLAARRLLAQQALTITMTTISIHS